MATVLSTLSGAPVLAGKTTAITNALKGVADDVVQGGVNAGKRLDNVIDDAIQGGAKGGRQLDGAVDDVIDGGADVGRAAPPPDGYDDIDVIGKQLDGAPKAPGLDAYDDIDVIGRQLDGAPKAPGLDGYDDIDVIGKQLDGAPKAPGLDGYDDIDVIGKQLDGADGAPRQLDPAATGHYADPNDADRLNAGRDIYQEQFIGIDDLNRELGDNAPRYVDPGGPGHYSSVAEADRLNAGRNIYQEQFIGLDELTDLNRQATTIGGNVGDVARVAPVKPKKPPLPKVGKGIGKTAVKAVRQLPAAPVLRAAAPAVSAKAAKAATRGLSRTTKVVVGGTVGVAAAGIIAGTTYVLYETVEPVREGIDTAVSETGKGLNTVHDVVDDGIAKVGEFLHPGDPASVTFYNHAGMLVEIYKVERDGSETALAVLSIEGERETVDVRIGDRLTVYKGGALSDLVYDVTTELNGSEIYVQ